MVAKISLSTLLPFAFLLALLPLLTAAEGETGSHRLDSGQCPPNAEATLVYSPFKPYFTWFKGDSQKCWVVADCLFESAGESRKQQFAATALIMGLIPLTLKDIAWPERRMIYVTKPLHISVEIVVLALGLVPLETGRSSETHSRNQVNNIVGKMAWRMRHGIVVMVVALISVCLLGCYACLTVMEVYSKRSSLGCPVPCFISLWYVISLVPAIIHVIFASFRRKRQNKHVEQLGHVETYGPVSKPNESYADRQSKKQVISAVQGADQDWPVQMAWAVYYIAGTLVFTSIMAVTVLELIVWVALSSALTACSKLLAFFLCLAFEKTGDELDRENAEGSGHSGRG